jgi:peptide/nickel transport system ATP-binding protein
MAAPILSIQNLSVALPAGGDRVHAVHNISLQIEPGQTLCVVGESGSGKSVMATTVMGLLARELKPVAGQVLLQGESLLEASTARLRQLRGQAMGMVFQEPMTALNPVMTCGDQIDELLTTHTDWPADKRRAQVRQMLEHVRLPDPERMMRSYPHQLSGGQRQRIVIAMAVILKPALLICDEPTTALDVTTQKEILKLIAQLQKEQGSAVLFITHDMGVVAEIADQVLVMNQGEAVESGPRLQVLKHPTQSYTQQLLAAVPSMTPSLRGPQGRGNPSEEHDLARHGERSAAIPEHAALRSQGRAPLLSGTDVSKTYLSRDWMGRSHPTHALHAASVAIHAGETVGIVGESGSGKSTFARCLIRLIDPTGGQIHWGDHEVASLNERALRPLRSQVQVVFQDPNRSLNPRRTVGQSLIEGAVNFGMGTAQAQALAEKLMTQVRLPVEALRRYPSQFSGGQRQRIAIARALACQPKVLVADEAVSALDVSVQAQILVLLREIQAEFGLGLLFITHDLRVAAQLCDRVIVMNQGKIVEQGPTVALYANPQDPYTQRLFASAPPGLEAL